MYIYPDSACAGERALAALSLSKQHVSDLRQMARQGEYSSLRAGLEPVCGATAHLSPGQLRDAADELVCFRVYMRVYLGKHRLAGVSPEQAATGFRDRMPELEAALRKPGQERMTVLPEAIDARLTLDKEGKISYSFTSLCQMLLFDMLSARQQGSSVLMCPLCSKVFAAGRSDVVYCPECRPTGARTAHTNSMRSDALLTVYAKARQRVYTAKSRGTLDAEQSKLLLSQMKDTLDRARLSGADAEAFAEQLSRITAKKVTNCY